MITLTEVDILSAKTTNDRLYGLPEDEYEEVCDTYPLETSLAVVVAAGMVAELSEHQYRLLDLAPLRIERFLSRRLTVAS